MDIERLLAGRKIIDDYRDKPRSEKIPLLRELGFSSTAEYSIWDRKMIFQAFKESYPIEGECDLCAGITEKEIKCVVTFSFEACYYKKLVGVPDSIYQWSLEQYLKGNLYLTESGVYKIKSGCPVDHGFYTIPSKIKEFPFDLTWRA